MSMKTLGLAAIALLVSANAALAHPHVVKTSPVSNAAVKGAPREIHITFNEAVTPKFSGLELINAAGAAVKTGEAKVNPGNKSELIVPVVGPVAAGVYKVNWHAVAADTHKVAGTFSFTVQ